MREVLLNILNNYKQDYDRNLELRNSINNQLSEVEKTNISNQKSKLQKLYTETYASEFKKYTSDFTSEYTVSLQVGSGKWSFVPYIFIRDTSITISPMDGYYIVYLFKKDMQGVYISLNRGKGSNNMPANANEIIKQFWISKLLNVYHNTRGFSFSPIMLNTNTVKTLEYQDRHIIGKYYDLKNMPDNMVLTNDLKFMIHIYKDVINIFKGLGKTSDEVNRNIVSNMQNHPEYLEKKEIAGTASIKLPEYSPDCCSDDYTGNDFLGVSDDVRSITNLVTMKDLKTPLSVGLFGKWGSGKSFLMKQIINSIESRNNSNLKGEDDDKFCRHVVQIEFNAWHYVDTNLIASLVTHIFENISFFMENKKNFNSKDSVKNVTSPMYKKLKISEDAINELIKRKEDTERRIGNLKDKLEWKERLIKENEGYITSFSIDKIVSKIKGDAEGRIIEAYGDFIETDDIKDFSTLAVETKKAYFITAGIFNILNNRKMHIRVTIIIFVMMTIFIAPEILNNGNKILNGVLNWLKQSIAANLIWILPLLNPLKEAVKKINNANSYINSLSKEQNRKIEQEKLILKENLKMLMVEKGKIEQESILEQEILKKLEEVTKTIESGKFLSEFIKEKINSTVYKEQLGFINIIRKDFEFLGQYINQIKDEDLSKAPVDRIILYIDDLDRCSPEKVVEVLQAIHLLLSFKMFVVIVPVDTRWVTRCLSLTYKSLFLNNSLEGENKNAASTYDYLEKIFQIPIIVKPMSNELKMSYIDGLANVGILDSQNDSSNYNNKHKDISTNTINDEEDDDIEISMTKAAEYSSVSIYELEKKDMYKFISIFGETPRTIKRFMNIYRLLKASGIVTDLNRIETLLILSIVTGLPNSSPYLLRLIMDLGDNEVIMDMLEKPNANNITDGELEKFKKFIKSNNELNQINLDVLKIIIPKVARYSFNQDII